MKKDLYKEAAQMGQFQAVTLGPLRGPDGMMTVEERTLYWTARHAARETATALLKSAQLLGLSEDQYEELRKVAAEVAYD
jgi:hypothetical protein